MELGVLQALLGRTPVHRMTLSFTAWTFLSVQLHEVAGPRASKLEAGSRRVPLSLADNHAQQYRGPAVMHYPRLCCRFLEDQPAP
jgi:hypothetical protein